MKFMLILSVLLGLVLEEAVLQPLSDQEVDQTSPAISLEADRKFSGLPKFEMLRKAFNDESWIRLRKSVKIAENIPTTFDARTHWPECPTIGLIRNQGVCPTCWAFGAVEVMSDRLCIASKGAIKVNVSAEDLINCCHQCHIESNKSSPKDKVDLLIWYKHWYSDGIVSGGLYGGDGCKPYATPPSHYECQSEEGCSKKCQPGYPVSYENDKTYGDMPYTIAQNVQEIQSEILQNGPVEAYFDLSGDFSSSGIYICEEYDPNYSHGHAVKILGWGNENGTDYWLIANSWGSTWNGDGFFKMRRGTNECGIEEGVNAALPKL